MFFQQSCLSNKTVNMCVLELCFVTFLFYDLNYPKCCHICTNKRMVPEDGFLLLSPTDTALRIARGELRMGIGMNFLLPSTKTQDSVINTVKV